MKILVTGGSGFLGRSVVARLASSHRLRLLMRPRASREGFPGDVEFSSGDVTDRDSLDRACAGCDAVVHAAALVKLDAPDAEFDRVNVGGLENVLAAAGAAKAARILYVSSFIALGPSEDGPGGVLDETSEPGERTWINAYERSKTRADRVARRALAAGAPLSVVYPGVIYGPGELTEGNIVLRHVLDLARGQVPFLLGRPERRWNYVFVADVATGIARALETQPRRRYVLGGENVTLGEFYRAVGELGNFQVPRRRLPDGVAKALGAVEKLLARWADRTPRLTPDLVEIYRHDWAYSSARAAAELGHRPRPLHEGLAASIAWAKESGSWPC